MSEVHVKGLAELNKFLQQVPVKMEKNIMRGALRAGIKPILADAKAHAAVASGKLRDGLKVKTRVKGGRVYARLVTTGPHAYLANWIEHGTVAHEIRPKGAKSLFLAGVFSELVNHPGARPRPFMRPAMDARAQEAVLAAAEYIRRRLTKQGLDVADIVLEGDE